MLMMVCKPDASRSGTIPMPDTAGCGSLPCCALPGADSCGLLWGVGKVDNYLGVRGITLLFGVHVHVASRQEHVHTRLVPLRASRPARYCRHSWPCLRMPSGPQSTMGRNSSHAAATLPRINAYTPAQRSVSGGPWCCREELTRCNANIRQKCLVGDCVVPLATGLPD